MTTKFNAEFIDVEAIESRGVTPDGRVTGLSRHRGREVKIVVLEEPPCCATVTYGAGIEDGVHRVNMQPSHEPGTFVGNDFTIDGEKEFLDVVEEKMAETNTDATTGGQHIKKTLSTQRYEAGYEIRTEEHETPGGVDSWIMKTAYTPEGAYIGNPKKAHFLCVKNGIKPELADKSDHVCSIGFSERTKKWFGWSHRAACGFGVGDTVKEGDCTASSGWTDDYLAEHPEDDMSLPVGFVAKNLDDAKRMAMAFAESVG